MAFWSQTLTGSRPSVPTVSHPLVVQHSETEVAQLQPPAAVGVHVGRLHVQVEHAGAMQRRQPAGHVTQHLRHRRRAQPLLQRRLQPMPR